MRLVFLDRDGVINEYPGTGNYVTSWQEFKFIPGSIEGIRKLKEKNFKVAVISNQSGVGKGIYSYRELERITQKMLKVLKSKGVVIDGVYYCIHRPEENCNCRKPRTGLLEKALTNLGIKNNSALSSFFIGDSFQDMEAARQFGAKSILILSGREKISNRKNWKFEPDYIFDNLLLAAHYLCKHFDG